MGDVAGYFGRCRTRHRWRRVWIHPERGRGRAPCKQGSPRAVAAEAGAACGGGGRDYDDDERVDLIQANVNYQGCEVLVRISGQCLDVTEGQLDGKPLTHEARSGTPSDRMLGKVDCEKCVMDNVVPTTGEFTIVTSASIPSLTT